MVKKDDLTKEECFDLLKFEYSQRNMDWKRVDNRAENSIIFYLGIITAIISIIGISLSINHEITAPITKFIISIALIILILSGFILINRMYYSDISKQIYITNKEQ